MLHPKSREAARTLLHRMADEKVIRHQKTKYIEVDDLWMLPGVHFIEMGQFNHSVSAAWLYVRLVERLSLWAVEKPVGPGLAFDRGAVFTFSKARFFIERDLGNMKIEDLIGKVDLYIKYMGPNDRLLFDLSDGHYKADKNTAQLSEYCYERRRKYQIGFTKDELLMEDPWGSVVYLPSGEFVSLERMGVVKEE